MELKKIDENFIEKDDWEPKIGLALENNDCLEELGIGFFHLFLIFKLIKILELKESKPLQIR